jgi:hypothetical protein
MAMHLLFFQLKSINMKKIILSLAFSGVISFVSAQTTSGQGAGNTTPSFPGAVKKTNKKNGSVAAMDTINNRKIYKSKKTGQAATATGQQATGTNGSHANLPKNAARAKND